MGGIEEYGGVYSKKGSCRLAGGWGSSVFRRSEFCVVLLTGDAGGAG